MQNLINPYGIKPKLHGYFLNSRAGAPDWLYWKAAFKGAKLQVPRKQLHGALAVPAARLWWNVLWAEAAEQQDRECIYSSDPTSTALRIPF